MSVDLNDAVLHLRNAVRNLEAHVDKAPSPRSRQRGTELAGWCRKIERAATALQNRDRQMMRAEKAKAA